MDEPFAPTLPPSCQEYDPEDPTCKPQARYWGHENPCANLHHHTNSEVNGDTLGNVWWLRLGSQTAPMSAQEWFSPARRELQKVKLPWMLDFDEFLAGVDLSRETLAQEEFHMKLPGCPKAHRCTNEEEWFDFCLELARRLENDAQYRCRRPPPVLLLCTAEQVERRCALGWENAAMEEALACADLTQQLTQQLTLSELSLTEVFGKATEKRQYIEKRDITKQLNDSGEADFQLDDDKQEDINPEVAEMLKLLPKRGLMDDNGLWPLACRFFRHDPSNITQGVHLPGMRHPTRPYQMLNIYKVFHQYRIEGYNGIINASKPGLGKTMETWHVYASIVLAQMSKDAFLLDKSAHQKDGINGCALYHPHGIECYCIKDGMTRTICQTVAREPHLIIAPATITSGWCKSWAEWLTPTVKHNGCTLSDLPLFLLSTLDGSGLREMHMRRDGQGLWDDGNVQGRIEMPPLRPEHYQPKYSIAGKLKPLNQVRDATNLYYDTMVKAGRLPKSEVKESKQITNHHEWLFGYISTYLPSLEFEPTRRKGVIVPRRATMPQSTISVAPERLALVCSQPFVSTGGLDKAFSVTHEIQRQLTGTTTTANLLRILCCFTPSTICYDEFARAKGTKTRIMAILRDIGQISVEGDDKGAERARFLLLSGTPMTTGPGDLEGPLELISASPTREQDLQKVLSAFNKVMRRRTATHDADRATWREGAGNLLVNCMFQRDYGEELLGFKIPDPRTKLKPYPPIFPSVRDLHKTALEEAQMAFRKLIQEKANRAGRLTEGAKSRIFKSSEWHHLLLVDACPGLSLLHPDLLQRSDAKGAYDAWNELKSQFERNDNETRQLVEKLRCKQLDLIVRRVRGDVGRPAEHGVILAIKPLIAKFAALWIQHHTRNSPVLVELIAADDKGGAKGRIKRIDRLYRETQRKPDQAVIIVSTFDILATGVDGLQRFASYMMKLGEPFTCADTEQALARIHRSGQQRPVKVYGVYGAEGGPNHQLYLKNAMRADLGLSGGVLSALFKSSG